MSSHVIKPIARIRSDFKTKFGIPRQAGIVEELEALASFLRNSFKKLPSAVCKAAYQDDPYEHTVRAVTVAMEIS